MRLAKLSLWVCIGAGFTMATKEGQACTCSAPATAAEAYANASAVFTGRVTRVSRPFFDAVGITRTGNHRVTFEISRRWKGPAAKRAVVVTRLSGEACGFPFEDRQEYLVYVAKGWGGIETGICTGTKKMAGAEAEMEQLDGLRDESPRRKR
jgi:hypothetical protein